MIKYDFKEQTFSSKTTTYKITEIPSSLIYEWIKTGQLSKGGFIIYLAHVAVEGIK